MLNVPKKIETEISEVVTMPKVDFSFIADAMAGAMGKEADAIEACYDYGDNNTADLRLGRAVRAQIEKYRLEIYEADLDANQALKRGESFHD